MFGLLTLGSRIQMMIAAVVVLTGVYFYWKKQVETAALMEYNQRQLDQVLRDQEAFQQKMSEVEDKQKSIESDLTKQNEEITITLKNLQDYLYSEEAKKQDRPASIILKNTITQLNGGAKK